jgi:L-fuculose-phosphate aldolase
MAASPYENALRVELCDAYYEMERLGLIAGTAGNISVRLGEDMLISPTGATSATITPDRFVRTRLDGTTDGDGIPSSEWEIHAGVYRAGSGQAVVHAHPDNCVALSCLRQPLPAFHYMVASFGGDDVLCVPYYPFGSEALARAAGEAMRERSACLLANHGMVCRGSTLSDALARAVKLEMLVRQYRFACQFGPPALLTSDEMRLVHSQYAAYGKGRLR